MSLETTDLSKDYGKLRALDGFSYNFSNGIYGLLGPNGAGKSTLMNILTENLKATDGSVVFEGTNINKLGSQYLAVVGYMPQQQGIYPGFTLSRFLYYMAALKGISKKDAAVQIDQLISQLNLSEYKSKKLGGFSGGMKQRALIAQALLGDPKIVILDEPTAGLDPKERIRIRNLIAKIAFDRIVIIATHVVPDIEFIAKEVIFMKKGRIADSGVPTELCAELYGGVFEILADEKDVEEISEKYKVINISHDGEKICVRVLSDEAPRGFEATLVKPTLEDLYLKHFDQ